jgi:hypothetical protein
MAVILGKEPYPHQFVGLIVAFDLRRKGGVVTTEKGEVVAQEWLGFTERGKIPEYAVTIIGASGRAVRAFVTEDHVQPIA